MTVVQMVNVRTLLSDWGESHTDARRHWTVFVAVMMIKYFDVVSVLSWNWNTDLVRGCHLWQEQDLHTDAPFALCFLLQVTFLQYGSDSCADVQLLVQL